MDKATKELMGRLAAFQQTINRSGTTMALDNEAEIEAAWAARTAIDPLSTAARARVMTWLAEAFDFA